AVASDIKARIAGIFAKLDLLLSSKFHQRTLGTVQQWPNQCHYWIRRGRTLPLHTRQSRNAAAAEESQKEKLDLVIKVVSQSDAAHIIFKGRARQKIMPQFSRSHFEGNFVPTGKSAHVRPLNQYWQLQFRRAPPDQLFIGQAA